MNVDDLLERIHHDPATGCWLWSGATAGRARRPVAYRHSRRVSVARELWSALRGPLHGSLVLRSRCSPTCVNPAHAETRRQPGWCDHGIRARACSDPEHNPMLCECGERKARARAEGCPRCLLLDTGTTTVTSMGARGGSFGAISAMRAGGPVTVSELAAELGLTVNGAQRLIMRLVAVGRVGLVGKVGCDSGDGYTLGAAHVYDLRPVAGM